MEFLADYVNGADPGVGQVEDLILENESDLFLQGHAIDIMAPVVQRLAGT